MEIEKLLKEGSKENIMDINPEAKAAIKKATKDINTDGKYVVFWGSVFSNFFPTRFYLDGRFWTSSEKYFMYMKAKTFNDAEIAEKILESDKPADIKHLGRQVKNFSNEEWDKVKEDIMYKAVEAKFNQDGLCNACIKEFPYQTFVEGSPYDKIWGIGIEWNNNDVFDETKWKGQNLLGKILTRVRNKIFMDALDAMDYCSDEDMQ